MEFTFSSAEEGITTSNGCKMKPGKSQQSSVHAFSKEDWTSLLVHLDAFKSRLDVFLEDQFSCSLRDFYYNTDVSGKDIIAVLLKRC